MAMELAGNLPNNTRAVQCKPYMKEIDASGKLPANAGAGPDVLDVSEKKPPAAPTPLPEPAVVSLQASSIPVTRGVIGGVENLWLTPEVFTNS